jgi:hypothetical protein
MAKRSIIRSQADDSATPSQIQPRARRSRMTAADADIQTAPAATAEARSRSVELDPEPHVRMAGDTIESVSKTQQPSDDDIRLRAYQRYLERGGSHGRAFDDWVEAERELKLRGL